MFETLNYFHFSQHKRLLKHLMLHQETFV